MSKNLKIMIPLLVVLIIGVLVIGALAYILFSRKTDNTEMIFPATEVGMPQGPNVTKSIGPAGGALTSPDGKLTLTVPQNALTETVSFSIQPITNKSEGGLGLAYRLEPNGKIFATPLELAVHYDEKDLDGTVAEALSLAYQDAKGAWHLQKATKLDQAAKTLTIAPTHFTDFAALAGIRISPVTATLHLGEELHIHLVQCKEPGFWDKLLSRPLDCSAMSKGRDAWELRGPGRLDMAYLEGGIHGGVTYLAPAKKPTPNVAYVELTTDLYFRSPVTGETTTERKTFSTIITILGPGYTASGHTADLVYSGDICSLEKSFTVNGSVIGYKFEFTPSSATAGTVTITAAGMRVTSEGGGTYKIEGADTDKPRIAMTVTAVGHSPVGDKPGGGTMYIDLVPLDKECKP